MKTVVLTFQEVALLMALTANLDPDSFKSDEAKALIYKCKSTQKSTDRDFFLKVVKNG